jgi:predicted cupin superfamily sugar epimerase
MTDKLVKIIKNLNLTHHPEGGYYRETYRSDGKIKKENLSSRYSGERNYSTCIYFLLTSGSFSAFHRIVQDEVWHYYDGFPVILHLINPDGKYSNISIGRDIELGEIPQFVIPGGTWFAAEVSAGNEFSLVGCTVSPGFDFLDFELPGRQELIFKFPHLLDIITRLTRA